MGISHQNRGARMTQESTRYYVRYCFYKVAPEWRRLPQGDRERSKAEYAAVLDECSSHISITPYSLLGTRGDADYMLWTISPSLEMLDQLAAQTNRTELGKYLTTPYSYLAMTRRSPYIDEHTHQGQEGTGEVVRTVGRSYLFVYPFVKTHDWYQLPGEQRQEIMAEHFQLGHKFPSVKISTSYSFGLDDQEFMLGFETDNPSDFLDLVMVLRESKARPYTLRDTPIFTCLQKPLKDCLDGLG
jgi:chlorite dismutase